MNPLTTLPNSWRLPLVVGGILLLTVALVSINLPYGFSMRHDGETVVRNGMQWAHQGYVRSRTWGYPAYEAVIYPILYYFGTSAAKLYSMMFCIGNGILFFLIARRISGGNLSLALPAGLGFLILPVTIITGNTILETSQGLFFALCGLWFFVQYFGTWRKRDLYWLAFFLGLATATRPDYLIFSAAAVGVLLRRGDLHKNRVGWKDLILFPVLYLAVGLLPYLLVYGNLYASLSVVIPDPLSRKIIRAILGFAALWGVPAILVTAAGGWIYRSGLLNRLKILRTDPLILLFAASLALYAIRYVMLPDELEYIYVLVPLFLIVLLKLLPHQAFFVALMLALGLPNIVQVHFFDRDPVTNDNRLSLGISPGAIYQDRQMRLLNEYKERELPALSQQIAARYGQKEFIDQQSTLPNALVIMPEEDLRYYRADRIGGALNKVFRSQTIIVYPLPHNYGWKAFSAFHEWKPLTLDDFRQVKNLPGSAKDRS